MRVQRFRKRRTLNANIEKTDDTSMCNLSRHNPSNIIQKIHEELYNKKLSAEEDEEFDTDCENETSNVSNFNDININSTQDTKDTECSNDIIKYNELDQVNDISSLRDWALKYKVNHDCLDDLLKILRKKYLPDLPKTAKTFLKTTSANYNIEIFSEDQESQFVYFGLSKYLKTMININLHAQNNIIELLINIDGAPLFNSSNKQLWPILCKVYFQPDIYEPFPAALYCGNHKPSNIHKYLQPFIEELRNLYREGILINEKHFHVCIKAFICDRPARSLTKCIKNHGGYYACERCNVRGIRVNKRVIYPFNNDRQRTDESFRNEEDPSHHIGISPLILLPEINMVTMFVLDFMHLCCLGTMKKMFVNFWLKNKLAQKLTNSIKFLSSQNLLKLQN